MLKLAADLSDNFDMESLTMYDALKEVWSNANKCSYNPVPVAPKSKVSFRGKQLFFLETFLKCLVF